MGMPWIDPHHAYGLRRPVASNDLSIYTHVLVCTLRAELSR